MYTILQKLDNIERALHRYDETRQVSFDTVPYRAATQYTLPAIDVARFFDALFHFVFSLLRLIEMGGDTYTRFSYNEINVSLTCKGNESKFRMNATRKKTDNQETKMANKETTDKELFSILRRIFLSTPC